MENQNITTPAPLVEVWRGEIIESRHRGHVVACEPDGKIVAHLGAPETVTYLRSSAKPHQAIPLIVSGAADRFGFTAQEIALACGSHNGEAIHVETVAGMLKKIGLDARALKCGVHEPFSREVARELHARGKQPNVLQNNCSGKHTGMLAVALHINAPTETYDQLDNPVQQLIRQAVAQFAGVPSREVVTGVDGCGVVVWGMTVAAMARMYAGLVAPPDDFPVEVKTACQRIVDAMREFPEMVGGTHERLDTEIMRAGQGGVISKVGAEGVYTLGVLPCEKYTHGLGLALKIEDGEDRRARPTVVIETLRQLSVLGENELQHLMPYASFEIRNHRGDSVGSVRPQFELKMQQSIG
ncbi:MAG: asparaginase [Pyrinomonadaceae bacterium]